MKKRPARPAPDDLYDDTPWEIFYDDSGKVIGILYSRYQRQPVRPGHKGDGRNEQIVEKAAGSIGDHQA
ncbi:hypothetical protein ACFSWD_28270 [Paenibacillus xanthanilyticus]